MVKPQTQNLASWSEAVLDIRVLTESVSSINSKLTSLLDLKSFVLIVFV